MRVMEERELKGKVEVSTRAISTIAWMAIQECYGVVGTTSQRFRSGLAEILQHDNYHKGIDVKFVDSQIIIDLYVVIEYGTKISEVARSIASNVKYAVEKSVGLPVVQVNINVQGLRISDRS